MPVSASPPTQPAQPAQPPASTDIATGAPLSVGVRCGLVTSAAVPLLLLVVAGLLQPSPGGLGTHRQLGLPPCTSLLVFGVRCPACGMTTSWSHFARGQWSRSVRVHAGGFALAIYSIGVSTTLLWIAASGRRPGAALIARWGWATIGVATVTAAHWAWRIAIA